MDKSNYKEIKSLNQFVKEINILTKGSPKGFYVFRGQGNHSNEVQSGAYRRLISAYGKEKVTVSKLIEYHNRLIDGAKNRSESHNIIKDKCEIILLGEIQHYGGATNLIDFTFNSLVALYFACKSKGDKFKKSKVYCLNTDSVEKFSELDSKKIYEQKISFKDLIDEIEETDEKKKAIRYYKWIPPIENFRITKQDSIFIFNGEGKISDSEFNKIFVINNTNKQDILNELEKGFFITEESLFPDFVGYVEANSAHKPLEKIDEDYFFDKALDLQQKGDFDNSIHYYKKAIEIKPDYHQAWYNMGNAYYEKGEKDEAIKCFEKAVEFKPNMHEAWFNMGNVYYEKGEKDEAIKSYKKAIEIKPDKYEAWYNMGITYGDKGEKDETIKSYKKAIEIKPNYYDAWYNLGIAYDDNGEKDETIKCFEKAAEFKPDMHEAWYNMGIAYDDKGEKDEAIKCFEKAVEFKPDDYDAWNYLGNIYNKKGEKDKADECFKKAKEVKKEK